MSRKTGAARVLPLGDTAFTVEFGREIDPTIEARVTALTRAIADARAEAEPRLGAIVDVVPTLRSLTVHFDPDRRVAADLAATLADLAERAGTTAVAGRHWRLPACFDPAFAPDLDDLAARAGLDRRGVIDLLLATRLRVAMIGFMPGFPYMTGVPAVLAAPRLPSPRTVVPARSIALAGEMCAVYPWASPGGWRLVGSTPVDLFDATAAEPALLAAGDTVDWVEISAEAHGGLVADLAAGRIARDSFRATGDASC